MLLYGNSNVLGIIYSPNCIIYNISSMREGFPRLPALIPPNQIGHLDRREFDIAYADYIMNNDVVFKQFFDIIFLLYGGTDVFLLMDESDWSENIIESILKLIQQRYGYNAAKINTFDDYIFAANCINFKFDSNFGIYNLDIDKERYTYIVESVRIQNGGDLIYVE